GLEGALRIMRDCDSKHGICRVLNDVAETRIELRDHSGAEAQAQEALSRAVAAGDQIEEVRAIRTLSVRARETGEHDRALTYATESRSRALDCGWLEDAAKASLELARVNAALGRRRVAREFVEEAVGNFDRIGSTLGVAECERLREQLGRRGRG